MKDEKRIGITLKILANKVGRSIELAVSENVSAQTTAFQGRIISFVLEASKEGKVYQKDIEKRFDIRRSTVTGILKLMEKNGLITRKADDSDARQKQILLTKEAVSIQSKIREQIESVESSMLEALTEEEKRVFFEIAEKLSKAIEERMSN